MPNLHVTELIIDEHCDWSFLPSDFISLIDRVNNLTFKRVSFPKIPTEISLCLTNNGRMQSLNLVHREKNHPTNVLSLPIEDFNPYVYTEIEDENLVMLGDIFIGDKIIIEEAAEKNIDRVDYLLHLYLHGLLHLLGFDHIKDDEAEIMEDLESKILGEMGIRSPYLD